MGSGVQPESMAQMVQMITSLGDLQLHKRQLDQNAVQFKQTLAQTAERLGFERDDARFKNVTKTLETLASLPSDTRDAYAQLTKLMGGSIPPEAGQLLSQIGLKMPETAQTIRDRLMNQGVKSMNSDQQGQLAQATAMTGATGMNPGQMAQSQLLQTIAQGGNNFVQSQPGLATTLGAGLAGNMAAPASGIGQIAMANTPGAPLAAARIGAGLDPTAGQVMSNRADLLRQQAELAIASGQQSIALAGLARRQNLDPQEAVQALNTAADIAAKAVLPTNNPATRKAYWALYNGVVKRIDPSGSEGLMQQDPDAKSYGSIMSTLQKFGIGGSYQAPGQTTQQVGPAAPPAPMQNAPAITPPGVQAPPPALPFGLPQRPY